MATIIINISPSASNNICATAIKTDNSYTTNAWSNPADNKIQLIVPELGEYLLKYSIVSTTPTPKMGIIGPERITLTSSSTTTIYVDYVQLVTYTICIDEKNNTYNYLDDAINMKFGSADWDSMPIFKQIQRTTFNNDTMVEFKKFAYRIYREKNKLYISVTNDKDVALGDFRKYTYDAFSRIYPGDIDKFYIGAYKGYINPSTGRLRSIAGVQPTTNLLYSEAQIAAKANGEHYHIMNYAQLKAIQCLYLIKYGPRDAQSIIGRGIVDLTDDRTNVLAYLTGYNSSTSNTLSFKVPNQMEYGVKEDGEHHVVLFGIEDFWGNIFEWIEDVESGESNYYRTINTSYNQNNIQNLLELKDQQMFNSGISNNIYGRIHSTADISQPGFVSIAADQKQDPDTPITDPSPLWSDCCILRPNCKALFGGGWADGNSAGPFCLYFYNSGEEKYGIRETGRAVGARLAYS